MNPLKSLYLVTFFYRIIIDELLEFMKVNTIMPDNPDLTIFHWLFRGFPLVF